MASGETVTRQRDFTQVKGWLARWADPVSPIASIKGTQPESTNMWHIVLIVHPTVPGEPERLPSVVGPFLDQRAAEDWITLHLRHEPDEPRYVLDWLNMPWRPSPADSAPVLNPMVARESNAPSHQGQP